MLDAATVISVLAAFTLGAVAVYAALARARDALQQQAAAAQSALAMADLRLASLTASQGSLAGTHQQLEGRHQELLLERERLVTTLERTADDLRHRSDALAVLQQRLETIEDSKRAVEANLQVSVFRGEELVAQVIALEARVRLFEQEARSQTRVFAEVAAQARALETERNGLLVRLSEQKTWIEEQNQLVEQKVANLATQLLEDKARKFTELNRKELDALVTPFKEQLGEFRQRVDHIHAADARDRGQLQEQVAQLARLNQAVSQQAQALTNALTISSKSMGDWGEVVLRRILEDSELRAEKEYFLQKTVEGDGEARQRPDAIVYLPEGRQVVIDAKVSNKSWTDYCAAVDEDERNDRLDAHVTSLRAHIRELSGRDYPSSPDLRTVDFVLMFVPVEAALLTALTHDESLYQEAYRSKIILVTPTTLMLALKLIEGMWLFQRRKESTDKIAEAGRKLFEKLTVFADTFVDIGTAIERAHGTFEKAKGQLTTGRGNVVKLAQKMVELGVGPGGGKVMPRELLEQAEAEDDDSIDQAAVVIPGGVNDEDRVLQ